MILGRHPAIHAQNAVYFAWLACNPEKPWPAELGKVEHSALPRIHESRPKPQRGPLTLEEKRARAREAARKRRAETPVTDEVIATRRRYYAERRARLGLSPPKAA